MGGIAPLSEIIASEIGLDEEDDVLTIGFRDDNNYLFFSKYMDEIDSDVYFEI